MEATAAVLFGLLTLGVVVFQLALAAGAPWGEYAMGGAYPGKYPAQMRVAAAVQAVLLSAIGWTILSAAEVARAPWLTPDWLVWIITALLAIGLVLNLITPSARERRIWAPVVALMLACCAVVALG